MIVALRVLQRGDFPEKRFHDLLVLHAIFDFFSVFQLWWFSYYYSGKVHIHEISRNSHLTSRFLKSFKKELYLKFRAKNGQFLPLKFQRCSIEKKKCEEYMKNGKFEN